MTVIADGELERLARGVGEALHAAGLVAVTAESCTGGWIAKCLTDVAGSSAWFDGAFVTYSNTAKTLLLGVPPAALEADGAVSEAVVCDMAAGALQRSGASASVAVSGIAGPGGGSPDKPVGTVWLAWATGDGRKVATRARCVHLEGDREAVRRQAVALALEGLAATAQARKT